MRCAFLAPWVCACVWAAEPALSWVDPDTHHRVVRLTSEPGSASLYFNQSAYTPDGREMVYTVSSPGPRGIRVVNLETLETKPVADGRVRIIETGRKTPTVYYMRDGAVFSASLDTGVERQLVKLPPRASVSTVNADETLAAGTYEEAPTSALQTQPATPQAQPLDQPANKGQRMEQRLAARIPMVLFVADLRTGAVRTILKSTDWLNHLLFSPSDPTLLMFCHEGPWHKVDRIWTIRTDGSGLTKIHTRAMAMEIAGHEFWSADGATIWYDLQTPRGEVFWLAGYKLATSERRWYHLDRNEWSIHFNASRDGRLFAGDGGDEGQVAHAPDGKWLYLFRPEAAENRGIADAAFVRPGVLRAERLVNMSKHDCSFAQLLGAKELCVHDYRLEPNVSFTPDGKRVVFRSNMFGPTYVFAVEVAKAP